MAALGIGCMLFVACAMAERVAVASDEDAALWAMDPGTPGSDLPAQGRSLFDFAMSRVGGKPEYDIPRSFDALVRRLESGPGLSWCI